MYIIGISPDKVRTSTEGSEFALGTLGAVTGKTGPKAYVYVKSTAGVAAGQVVSVDAAFDASALTTASPKGATVGVAVGTISAGGYGWVQIYGAATCAVIGGIVAGSGVTASATAGSLDALTAAGSIPVIGVHLSAVNGTVGTVALSWPKVAHAL